MTTNNASASLIFQMLSRGISHKLAGGYDHVIVRETIDYLETEDGHIIRFAIPVYIRVDVEDDVTFAAGYTPNAAEQGYGYTHDAARFAETLDSLVAQVL